VGVDCVFPILLWEADALAAFTSEVSSAVNILSIPQAPTLAELAELAELGVARVSYGGLLHHDLMEQFSHLLASLPRHVG
jgi:2-methylisocitrate lyase-like PEP mutase family enzyme